MRAPEKMIIYNLFPLLAGPFPAWKRHFARAAEMGFNWIFLNPLQRPGLSGSLYAVADYFDFHPLLRDPRDPRPPAQQLAGAVRSAHELGLSLMIDLVVNHCAVDADLVQSRPEWFVWEAPGKLAHPFALEDGTKVVWGDLARFDHQHTPDGEGLFQFFFRVVKYLRDLGFRAFRCDAAYQVPPRFWERLIGEARRLDPRLLFFCETLGCTPEQTVQTAAAGFDYLFNSSKWWDFESPWLLEQYNLTRQVAPSVSFPESHDTSRLCAELDGNVEGLKQRYLFAAFFSAALMMPIGFEFGFRRRLDVVKTRPEDWEETRIDLRPYIRQVNEMKAAHPVLQGEGPLQLIPAENPRVLVLHKSSAGGAGGESLLALSKDIRNRQTVNSAGWEALWGKKDWVEIFPGPASPPPKTPFAFELAPGAGIVWATRGQ